MCGIVSLVCDSPITSARLRAATDALVHRGPDGEGFYFSPDRTAALGHRRLSIVDLAGGAQPIANETGDIHIVVNGEFYGFGEIRRDLEARGHRFATGSDSEVALHLYEEYGLDCLRFLRGEFAFALWDEKRKRLFAARDRFGIKPLVYARRGAELMLASEAKALFAAGLPARWDEAAFFHAASLQYTPADRTLFDGVLQLPPGHFMVFERGSLSLRRYWDMDYPVTAAPVTEKDAIEGFYAALEESIRVRLHGDVPVCAHLSGGLDSSAVLGLASKLAGKPLPAFTISFTEPGYDELAVARETAGFTGSALHAVTLSQEDLVANIPAAVRHGEGLAINGHLAGKFLLNRAIRAAGYKVALTGEGSDETLAGYAHLRQDMGAAAETLARTNVVSLGAQLPLGEQLSTQAVKDALGYVPAFLAAKAGMGLRFQELLDPEYRRNFAKADAYADLMRATDVAGQLKGRSRVDQSLYLWNKSALANYILRTLGDGMEMSHSVEGRLPMLDHKLFEYARSLPLNFKIRNGVEKYALREAAKPALTPTVYRREKHPFMAPPVSLFSSAKLDAMIGDFCASARFRDLPFFDHKTLPAKLARIRKLPREQRIAWEPALMMTLSAACLHEAFDLGARPAREAA
jgi:asparagine synthase (glutamine-hydrolysing)